MDTCDVIGVYSDAYDGDLGDCATIVDTHVRCPFRSSRFRRRQSAMGPASHIHAVALLTEPRASTTLQAAGGQAASRQLREDYGVLREA